jgi:excisionase family DNA binding protein
MNPDVQPRLFTYEEAGKYLGVSAATVKKLTQTGCLTVVKLGKAARIDRRQLDTMIDRTVTSPVPPFYDVDPLQPSHGITYVDGGKR